MADLKDQKLDKYDPSEIEQGWYQYWEDHGVFHDEPDPEKEPYSIVLPPPNVTGQLHMGHALDNTLQDILIRYKRMQGYNVLWLPGKDHAGIATQVKVEKQIAEEVERVKSVNIGTGKVVLDLLEKYGSTELKTGVTLAELVKRPELNYEILAPIDKHRPELAWDVAEQVNINLKYEGYIERQLRQVEHFKKLESKIIPDDIDYNEITGLRKEAMQKLNKMKPRSIGQASRISGVSPADISVLLVYMEQFRRKKM